MEYLSIYRRFRPRSFDKVIGQGHIVRTLTNQIKRKSVSHAYLFTGARGTGKTTCAKIFARAVNCLDPKDGSPCGRCEICRALAGDSGTDVIEIDAASNSGVNEIRALCENVMYRPFVAKHKVYIIDEAHMLSAQAFNALLKTLEEPPEHAIFILATTEAQKIPRTILSRCIRFDFRLVDPSEIEKLLERIFSELGVDFDPNALMMLAVAGEGSVRDALSAADMCMSYSDGKITVSDALEVTCATDFSTLFELGKAILDGDAGKAVSISDRLFRLGRAALGRDLADFFCELLTAKVAPSLESRVLGAEERSRLCELARGYATHRIAKAMELMSGLETRLRFSSQPRILAEAAIVQACLLFDDVADAGLLRRVIDLETAVRAGAVSHSDAKNESVERPRADERRAVASGSAPGSLSASERANVESNSGVEPGSISDAQGMRIGSKADGSDDSSPAPDNVATKRASDDSSAQGTEETRLNIARADAEKPRALGAAQVAEESIASEPNASATRVGDSVCAEEAGIGAKPVSRAGGAESRTGASRRPGEIWGKVQSVARKSGDFTLCVCNSAKSKACRIEGDRFIVEVADRFVRNGLINARGKIENILKNDIGVDLSFECNLSADDSKSTEIRQRLTDLFGDGISFE